MTPRHRVQLNRLCADRGFLLTYAQGTYRLERCMLPDGRMVTEYGEYVMRTQDGYSLVERARAERFTFDDLLEWIDAAPLLKRGGKRK